MLRQRVAKLRQPVIDIAHNIVLPFIKLFGKFILLQFVRGRLPQ